MMNRRTFLKRTAAFSAAVGGIPAFTRNVAGANERVVVGVMGINDRGMDLAEELAKRKDVEVRYLADPDSRLFADRIKSVAEWSGREPKAVQDFRRILDDPEIDAIAIATPDHWHAIATIMACQAGKDVYVEKPVSHNIWESRKMIEAARKYERVVQAGTQNRSAVYCHEAIAYVHSGALGDVHFVRVMNSKLREPMKPTDDGPVPEGVDYDLWLGPAPMRSFNANHFHYSWHWFWNYGGGDLGNDGIHQIDLARWAIRKTYPHAVVSTGATYGLRDGRETPDTQTVAWEFDDVTLELEQTLWTPYMIKTPLELRDKGGMPNWMFNGTRVELYGSKQFMYLGRMGDGWQAFDAEGKSLFEHRGQFAATNTRHMENFVECVRSRNRPNADIEECHLSTLLAHYGNISFRTGRRLHVDASTEGFVDDAEANALVKRQYREPWTIRDAV